GAHLLRGGVGEVERLQQLVGPRPGRLPAVAEEAGDEDEVLVAGGVLVDRRELAGEAHLLAHPGGLPGDVVAEYAGRAAVGTEEGAQDADRRRLAGAVRAEQAVDGAALDAEVDAVDGAGVAELLEKGGCLD